MKRHALRTCVLAVAIALAACDSDGAAGPRAGIEPSLAKGGNIDTDSRAVLVWENTVMVSDGAGGFVSVPAGIQGDDYDRLSQLTGADEYQGQVCGVHAKIFNTSALSGSGDLVFDPDFDAPGKSCNNGVIRTLRFHLSHDGAQDAGPATSIGTFTNVRRIWFDAVSAGSTQPMRFIFVNQPGCESLEFNSAVGGSDVRVTRLEDSENERFETVRNWRVESAGTHRAMCMVTSRNKTVASGTTKFLPFAFTVKEVKYPYEIINNQ